MTCKTDTVQEETKFGKSSGRTRENEQQTRDSIGGGGGTGALVTLGDPRWFMADVELKGSFPGWDSRED